MRIYQSYIISIQIELRFLLVRAVTNTNRLAVHNHGFHDRVVKSDQSDLLHVQLLMWMAQNSLKNLADTFLYKK